MQSFRWLVLSGCLVACGADVVSLKSAMESYWLYMDDLVHSIQANDTVATARHAGAFRDFMGSGPHRDWQALMEADARTRYTRIAGHLQGLQEDAASGSPVAMRESFARLRGECMDCHFINMQGTRREALEAAVPGLN